MAHLFKARSKNHPQTVGKVAERAFKAGRKSIAGRVMCWSSANRYSAKRRLSTLSGHSSRRSASDPLRTFDDRLRSGRSTGEKSGFSEHEKVHRLEHRLTSRCRRRIAFRAP
jgi:hypothetical protein